MFRLTFTALALALALACASTFARDALAEGFSPTAVSLPDGPGSVQGLGSGYEPTPGTGTVGFTVAVEVPPGSGGLAPELAFRYDSGGGDSFLGLGWALQGVPSVRVRTSDGLPRFDGRDVIELVGFGAPSALIAQGDGTYRPRFEGGTFARAVTSDGGTRWEVRDRSGRIYRFGGPAAVESEGADIATWLLTEVLDRHGHRIRYAWEIQDGVGVLQSVTYNDFGPSVQNVVEFQYEARPDPRHAFDAGIAQHHTRRLSSVRVTAGGQPVRRYALTYAEGRRSLLTALQVFGRDDASSLPALSFEYSPLEVAAMAIDIEGGPSRTPADPDVALVDLDGDSLVDVLVGEAGSYRSYRNLDGLQFAPEAPWGAASSPSTALGAEGSALADFDGDGGVDLLLRSGVGDLRYLSSTPAGTFGESVRMADLAGFAVDDPDVRLVDLDGDRRIDLVASTPDRLSIAYNDEGHRFGAPERAPPLAGGMPIRFSDRGTTLCEMNGDGLTDLCVLRSTSLSYWLGRGRGAFVGPHRATGVPAFEPDAPYTLADVDGDGRDDLVRIGVHEADLRLAVGEGEMGPAVVIGDLPERGPGVFADLRDVNGTGTLDLLFVDVDAAGGARWRYFELAPRGRAGLLTRVVDGRGVTRTFEYAAAAATRPAEVHPEGVGTEAPARANVAMPVVTRTVTTTALGDPPVITEFNYGGGAWSPRDRTFGGFTHVIRRQLGDESTPTLETRWALSSGPEHPAMRGAVLGEVARDEAGRLLTRTVALWSTTLLTVESYAAGVAYARRIREDILHTEGEDTGRLTRTEWTHDAYGNVTREARWGEVVDDDPLAGGDETIVHRRFAVATDDWIVDLLAEEETTDGRGRRLAAERRFYDGMPHVGLPLSQVVRGDLRRREAWVEAETWALVESSDHDRDGHIIETRDGADGLRRFEWDAEDRTFLRREIVVLAGRELRHEVLYDRALGKAIESLDWGGIRRRFTYDPFGRFQTESRPGDLAGKESVRVGYFDAGPLPRTIVERRREVGEAATDVVETLSDGLGRERGRVVHQTDGRLTLLDAAAYDVRGQERLRQRGRTLASRDDLLPALSAPGPSTHTRRDALGRPVEVTSAGGVVTRTEYGPLTESFWNGAQSQPDSPFEHTPSVRLFDGQARLIGIRETLAGVESTVRFEHDAAGRLVSKTSPTGQTSRYTYDGRGWRTAVHDPDTGTHAYRHDGAGRVVVHVHPDGGETHLTYDRVGRALTTDDDGDGTVEVERTWDVALGGRLAMVRDPLGVLRLEYDDRGRVACTVRGVAGVDHRTCTRMDAQDREVAHIYPDGSTVELDLDASGRVVGVSDLLEVARDEEGRPLSHRHSGAVVTGMAWDADGRPTESTTTGPDGEVLAHLTWRWNGRDDLVAMQREGSGRATARDEYGYDNLHRLDRASGDWGESRWDLDPSGNSADSEYEEGHGSTPTRLGDATLTWDGRRRLIADGVRTYMWGADDRLHSVVHAGGHRVESVYDHEGARGLRRERDATGHERTTVFLGPWAEVQDGKLIRYVVVDDRRIIRLDGVRVESMDGTVEGAALFVLLALVAGLWRRGSSRRFWGTGAAVTLFALFFACGELHETSGADADPGADGAPSADSGPDFAVPDADADAEGDAPDVAYEHAGVRVLLYDQVGSLTHVIGPDGRVEGEFMSLPYGVPQVDTARENRRFAGLTHDGGVGVEMAGARVYVPALELWASVDPVALEEPERQGEERLGRWPTYGYAAGNPLALVDPSGRAPAPDQLINTVSAQANLQWGPFSHSVGWAFEVNGSGRSAFFHSVGAGLGVGVESNALGKMATDAVKNASLNALLEPGGWKKLFVPSGSVTFSAGHGSLEDVAGPSAGMTFSAGVVRAGISVSPSGPFYTLGFGTPEVGFALEGTNTQIEIFDRDWTPAPR
jgi:RHS repeat-associated protein